MTPKNGLESTCSFLYSTGVANPDFLLLTFHSDGPDPSRSSSNHVTSSTRRTPADGTLVWSEQVSADMQALSSLVPTPSTPFQDDGFNFMEREGSYFPLELKKSSSSPQFSEPEKKEGKDKSLAASV
jgi:hypothetical protein